MTLVRNVALLSLTLIVGGCGAHRQEHVRVYGTQDRDWWYPSQSSVQSTAAADRLGAQAFAWPDNSSLAVGDALGMACFHDTAAYVQHVRENRDVMFATAPTSD
ncbi:MAG: hypothetical protein D6695_05165 [Planctomycetota bacterium]|nr:MAG: hypothetical protein D6695_05165 [Planctomycetota bacterium]